MADTQFLKDNLSGTVPVEIAKEIMKIELDPDKIEFISEEKQE